MDLQLGNPFDNKGNNLQEGFADALALAALATGRGLYNNGRYNNIQLKNMIKSNDVRNVLFGPGFQEREPMINRLVTAAETNRREMVSPNRDMIPEVTQYPPLGAMTTNFGMITRKKLTQWLNSGIKKVLPSGKLNEIFFRKTPKGYVVSEASSWKGDFPTAKITVGDTAGELKPQVGYKDINKFITGKETNFLTKAGNPNSNAIRDYTPEEIPALITDLLEVAQDNQNWGGLQRLIDYRKTMGGPLNRKATKEFDNLMRNLANGRPEFVQQLQDIADATNLPPEEVIRIASYLTQHATNDTAISRTGQAIDIANGLQKFLPEWNFYTFGGTGYGGKSTANRAINKAAESLGNLDEVLGGAKTQRLHQILLNIYNKSLGADGFVLDSKDLNDLLGLSKLTTKQRNAITQAIFDNPELYNTIVNAVEKSFAENKVLQSIVGQWGDTLAQQQSVMRARGLNEGGLLGNA